MNERPILFSAPMVRAILDGGKTQTRRAVAKSNSICTLPFSALLFGDGVFADGSSDSRYLHVPAFAHKDDEEATVWRVFNRSRVGDRLWVRETFALECQVEHDQSPPHSDGRAIKRDEEGKWLQPHYRATDPAPELAYEDGDGEPCVRWKPSIFMPRWASRITLEITAVRVERLQDISEADAWAEGARSLDIVSGRETLDPNSRQGSYVAHYRHIWNTINGPGAWDQNPWVWVIEFKREPQQEGGK